MTSTPSTSVSELFNELYSTITRELTLKTSHTEHSKIFDGLVRDRAPSTLYGVPMRFKDTLNRRGIVMPTPSGNVVYFERYPKDSTHISRNVGKLILPYNDRFGCGVTVEELRWTFGLDDEENLGKQMKRTQSKIRRMVDYLISTVTKS